ncbi:hypothetical protein ACWIWK_05580 [Helicobacter sp. 23-1048]
MLIFLSLRASSGERSNSQPKKLQKVLLWQFVIVDCHALRCNARNDDVHCHTEGF